MIVLMMALSALGLPGCEAPPSPDQPVSPEGAGTNAEAIVEALLEAFNARDVDRIMALFSDDAELCLPRGQEPWGECVRGMDAVREAVSSRFRGIPDARYGEAVHRVMGDFAVSQWLLTGTGPSGEEVRVRGVDLLELRDGKVVRKDAYWKIVER